MRLGQKKLNWSKILLIAFSSLSASCCTKEIHPHVLDTQLSELREYKIIDPINLIIEFKESHPLKTGENSYGNGFWCLPPEDAAELKRKALECKNKDLESKK